MWSSSTAQTLAGVGTGGWSAAVTGGATSVVSDQAPSASGSPRAARAGGRGMSGGDASEGRVCPASRASG